MHGFLRSDKTARIKVVEKINTELFSEFETVKYKQTIFYFSDEDTYIRKSAYLTTAKIYSAHHNLRSCILKALNLFLGRKILGSDKQLLMQLEKSAKPILMPLAPVYL